MLNKQLLNVKDLYVDVEDKEILHGVDLSIGEGQSALYRKVRRNLV